MTTRSARRGMPVDWEQARRRLAEAAARTAESRDPSPERSRAILEARARELARPAEAAAGDAETIEVLGFALGAERFAIETRHVRQVVRWAGVTPVPCGHELLAGVVNLDGEILAVFDLGRALGVEGRPPAGGSRVVVLGEGRDEFGVRVDSAHEVATLRIGDLFETTAADGPRRLLRGVAAGAVGIIDGGELLVDERFRLDRAD